MLVGSLKKKNLIIKLKVSLTYKYVFLLYETPAWWLCRGPLSQITHTVTLLDSIEDDDRLYMLSSCSDIF